ncbi:DUF7210 family protein [Ottowia sp. VDI28]|uniref:DUF7210 family protein n=1 Tax=Ottowia sp. VDI28 TaxID=3133968 RepID=UPI003C305409
MTRSRAKARNQPQVSSPERVKLEREHEHCGVKHPPGAVIEVHPQTAEWLRAQGIVSKPTIKKD